MHIDTCKIQESTVSGKGIDFMSTPTPLEWVSSGQETKRTDLGAPLVSCLAYRLVTVATFSSISLLSGMDAASEAVSSSFLDEDQNNPMLSLIAFALAIGSNTSDSDDETNMLIVQ